MAFTNSLEEMLRIHNWGDSDVVTYTSLGNRATGRISQDYNQILTSGGNFIDPAFPHKDETVGKLHEIFDDAQGQQALRQIVQNGFNPRAGYSWVRIKDFIHVGKDRQAKTRTPVFSCGSGSVNEALSKTDVSQGTVGNCWFLAALGAISTNPEQFEHCVPTDNVYNETGVYHFVFWYQGFYIDVVVDDYIPVFPQEQHGIKYHQTVGSHPSDHGDTLEWWGPLVEKAYSKLMGSYLATVGGQVSNGFENITGGFPERFKLGRDCPHDLLPLIKKSLGTTVFLGLGCNESAWGLVGGHAYSITGHTTVNFEGENVELIRIRNPWGRGEWEGDFCDNDGRWEKLTAEERKNWVRGDDGEFWMRFEHMRQFFADLHVVTSYTEEDFQKAAGKLTIERHCGAWSNADGTAAGFNPFGNWQDNPKFEVNLGGSGNECILAVSLSAERPLQSRKASLFHVFKGPVNQCKQQKDIYGNLPAMSYGFQTYGFKLSPGNYTIVPATPEPGDERKFCLRILYQKA